MSNCLCVIKAPQHVEQLPLCYQLDNHFGFDQAQRRDTHKTLQIWNPKQLRKRKILINKVGFIWFGWKNRGKKSKESKLYIYISWSVAFVVARLQLSHINAAVSLPFLFSIYFYPRLLSTLVSLFLYPFIFLYFNSSYFHCLTINLSFSPLFYLCIVFPHKKILSLSLSLYIYIYIHFFWWIFFFLHLYFRLITFCVL